MISAVYNQLQIHIRNLFFLNFMLLDHIVKDT